MKKLLLLSLILFAKQIEPSAGSGATTDSLKKSHDLKIEYFLKDIQERAIINDQTELNTLCSTHELFSKFTLMTFNPPTNQIPAKFITTFFNTYKNLDINKQNAFGNTPAHIAILYGNWNVLIKLIESNANLTIKNKYDETPAELAQVIGQKIFFETTYSIACENMTLEEKILKLQEKLQTLKDNQ